MTISSLLDKKPYLSISQDQGATSSISKTAVSGIHTRHDPPNVSQAIVPNLRHSQANFRRSRFVRFQ